jgi:dihydrofolate reductase
MKGVRVVGSLEEGIAKALEETPSEIHIGGGAEIYKEALPITDKLFLTFLMTKGSRYIFS